MYSAIQRQQMLATVYDVIHHELTMGTRLELEADNYSEILRQHKATFVTLLMDGLLRGCIGSLVAREALILSIARNARNAAFHDPRFVAISLDELPLIDIEISILSECESIPCNSNQDLVDQLRPGVDGLIISDGDQSATFLPSVWENLADPEQFISELKVKAGMEPDHWSSELTAERYTAQIIR